MLELWLNGSLIHLSRKISIEEYMNQYVQSKDHHDILNLSLYIIKKMNDNLTSVHVVVGCSLSYQFFCLLFGT